MLTAEDFPAECAGYSRVGMETPRNADVVLCAYRRGDDTAYMVVSGLELRVLSVADIVKKKVACFERMIGGLQQNA